MRPSSPQFDRVAGFVPCQRDVEDVRAVLERELHTRSSLTVGDVLDIDFCGTLYRLRVLELQPQPQVSVIDTDMEVEVAPSVEYEEEAAVKAAAAARQEAELAEHTRVQVNAEHQSAKTPQ